MLIERIIGAFTFRKGVYAEVERDSSFTQSAWMLVALVSFLNALGATSAFGFAEIGKWLLAAVVSAVIGVLAFALGAYVVNFVGQKMFNADVSFEELVRTLGLANVWRVVGVLGIFGGFINCLLAPLQFIAAILGLVAWYFAAREALDLDDMQTVIVIVIGWVVVMVISLIGTAILGGLGLAAGVGAGLLTAP